jgi:hypothetical protein
MYDVEVAARDDASWSSGIVAKNGFESSREQIENSDIDLSVQESEPL